SSAAGGLTGASQFAVSASGTLAYLPAAAGSVTSVVWRSREGAETPVPAPPHAFATPRISPDGTRLALHAIDQDNDIWIWHTAGETLTRLTFDKTTESSPLWTRDGKRVIYTSNKNGVPNLFWKPADGTGQAEPLLQKAPDSNGALVSNSVTPDGKYLIYSVGVP